MYIFIYVLLYVFVYMYIRYVHIYKCVYVQGIHSFIHHIYTNYVYVCMQFPEFFAINSSLILTV